MWDDGASILDDEEQKQADLGPIPQGKPKRLGEGKGFWNDGSAARFRAYRDDPYANRELAGTSRTQAETYRAETYTVAVPASLLSNQIDACIFHLPDEIRTLIDIAAKTVRPQFQGRLLVFIVRETNDNDVLTRRYIEAFDENNEQIYPPYKRKDRDTVDAQAAFREVVEGTGHSDLLAVAAATPAAASDGSATPPPPHPQHEETNKYCDSATEGDKTGGNNNDSPPRSTVSLAILRECRAAMDGLRTIFKNAHDSGDRQTADTVRQEVEALQQDLMALLREFRIAGHPGGVAQPESSELPTVAPALWLRRDKSVEQTPPAFILAHYEQWLGKGLTQAHIRRLDKSLYMALHKWLHEGNKMPSTVNLPTQKEFNDQLLKAEGLPADPRQLDKAQRESMRLHEMTRSRAIRAGLNSLR